MKVLITGGTGFIGSRLALRCIADGHEIIALGRPKNPPVAEISNADEITTAGGRVESIELDDGEAVGRLLQGCDVVFNLAAIQHEMNVPDELFWEVNVEGVRKLVETCIDQRVGRFVHGSTIGVHGDGSPEIISENSPLEPTNIYDRTKKDGEGVVRSMADQIPVVILRIGETYGPGDRRLLKLFSGVKKRRFFLIGPGNNLHQPIFIDDMIDALLLSATHTKAPGETMLLAGPKALTTREMMEIVAEIVAVKPLPFRAPMSLFLAAAFVLEKTLRPLGIQPPLHRRRMNFFRLNLVFSNARAQEKIQFTPRTEFIEGARHTANWYREMGLL